MKLFIDAPSGKRVRFCVAFAAPTGGDSDQEIHWLRGVNFRGQPFASGAVCASMKGVTP